MRRVLIHPPIVQGSITVSLWIFRRDGVVEAQVLAGRGHKRESTVKSSNSDQNDSNDHLIKITRVEPDVRSRASPCGWVWLQLYLRHPPSSPLCALPKLTCLPHLNPTTLPLFLSGLRFRAMVVPSLPQELLELIIDAIHTSDGTAPLKTLSRVSRAWRPRSQNNIFKKLRLNCATMRQIRDETDGTIETTGNTASRQPPTVFSYVRKLHIAARQLISPENDGGHLKVLRFFTNVTSLRILDWDFREFETHHITHFLGHFGATARTLKLQECYVDSEVLIFLTSLFPSIDNLEVDPRYPCSSITYRVQKSDRPAGNVGFRGNLTLRFLSAQHEDFLAFVNENSSDVHSISAELCVNKGELQRLFECRGGNLLSVGIHSLWKQGMLSPQYNTAPTRRDPNALPRQTSSLFRPARNSEPYRSTS